jgi:hypothetical protein
LGYKKTIKTATDFIINEQAPNPVTREWLFDYITRHNNWEVTPVYKVLEDKDFDAFSIKKYDSYYIIYDSSLPFKRLIFILLQEIGHILLGHYTKLNNSDIMPLANVLNENVRFRNQANCFARNVLAPVPLFEAVTPINVVKNNRNIKCMNYKEHENYNCFNMTMTAWCNRCDSLIKCDSEKISEIDYHRICEYFGFKPDFDLKVRC